MFSLPAPGWHGVKVSKSQSKDNKIMTDSLEIQISTTLHVVKRFGCKCKEQVLAFCVPAACVVRLEDDVRVCMCVCVSACVCLGVRMVGGR